MQVKVEINSNALYHVDGDYSMAEDTTIDNRDRSSHEESFDQSAQQTSAMYYMIGDHVNAMDAETLERHVQLHDAENVYIEADGPMELDGGYASVEIDDVTCHKTDETEINHESSFVGSASQRVMTENILYGTH